MRSFDDRDAYRALRSRGIDEAILVQADDTAADTNDMLRLAADNEWVIGVVGWAPLTDPAAVSTLVENTAIVGLRHRLQSFVDDDVRESLHLLVASDVTLEFASELPTLALVLELADRFPQLRIVVDHVGRPWLAPSFEEWLAWATKAARRPNVSLKLSAFHDHGRPLGRPLTHQLVESALINFGSLRLPYGSDWPMTLETEDHADQEALDVLAELSLHDRENIFAKAASHTYPRLLRRSANAESGDSVGEVTRHA